VLPLKAIGFYEVSQHKRARSFLFGSIFSLGIIATFAALGCLVLLRQHSWGDLFAKAWFVWGLAIILLFMAASLFGLYTFRLPMGAYTFEPRHDTYSGNFLFGGLTAILSTPCTAPLFPGLLAWAAAQPSRWIGVGMLTMVGVGMAAPYMVLSAVPELARRFPRTGPWSELVKQMLGFMVLAVAVFIAGPRVAPGLEFWAIFAVLFAGSIFLIVKSAILAKGKLAVPIAVIIALLLSGGSFAAALRLSGTGGKDSIQWAMYDDDTVNAARHTGKLVLVEFTAHWCANCLTLEATVFRKPEVAETFKKYNVVAFRADLSDQNAPGWGALKQLNPAGGIPLTAIFPPNSPEPIVLSSLYSAQNLMDALEKASRTAVADAK
jgi:thiol:disulfide interchange protein